MGSIVWNVLLCWCIKISLHGNIRDYPSTWKTAPYHYPLPHQNWKFSWHPPNPDSQTEKRDSSPHRTGFHCSRVQLWCAIHTPFWQFVLYLMMWLCACSCLAMETHSMKLLPYSFCADINASRSLKLFSHEIKVGDFYSPWVSELYDLLCDFTRSWIMNYLVGKFHKLTYCKVGILSQIHVWIQLWSFFNILFTVNADCIG